MKYLSILFFLNLHVMTTLFAQQTFPLYPSAIPNSKPVPDEEVTEVKDGITFVNKITRPTITVYLPANPNAKGTAVIIFPGGGYMVNANVHEGSDVAKAFNEMGITAFVIKYRIPDDSTMINKEIGPLQDAQQAIKVVRERAAEWHVNASRVGIAGFSAGGHLASTAGTHFNNVVIENKKNINLRPDFMILVYPVISFQDSIAHMGSRNNLIGLHPTKKTIDFYSNELQVTDKTPPTFLVHAADDDVVNAENSLIFYQQLLKHKVPAEIHIYEKGGHGFGMNNKTTDDKWMNSCRNWMKTNGWL